MIAFIKYFIHAPCWNLPQLSDTKYDKALTEIRDLTDQMESVEDVRNIINQSMKIGLDPL